MLVASSLTGDLIAFVVTIGVLFVIYFKWAYGYWSRRNIPYIEPTIPYGNIRNAIKGKENISVSLSKIYHEMKHKGWRYGGLFTFAKPTFFITDLDIIKNVMTKDFQYFHDRDVYYNEKDPLQAHLLNLTGNKWKSLRSKLTPTFTSGKMKMMFNVMVECQNDLQKRMDREVNKTEPINIKEILACYTTNVIGSCAFGLEFKALEDENSEFRKIGRLMFNAPRSNRWKRTFAQSFPAVAKFLDMSFSRKEIADFILNMVEKTIEYREKNNYTRNDFMQSMIALKNSKPINSDDHDGKPLTMDEVASQCVVFFGAGFETSSTLMTFALYELGKRQDIQNILREEINEVLKKHNNEMSYESIQAMTYLNQVVEESLRMHPPGAQLNRKCVKDYKIPNTDVTIEKGTNVTVSILGIHHDPEYYPDPEKFDPDRFNEENRKSRHNYAHMPFGEGPRNCIGMRFGLLQAKVGLACLVKNFKFTVNRKTEEPMCYEPASLVLSVRNDVWLNAERV